MHDSLSGSSSVSKARGELASHQDSMEAPSSMAVAAVIIFIVDDGGCGESSPALSMPKPSGPP